MLELKEYQRNALDTFSHWLETLGETQRELETMIEMFRQAPTDIPIPDELRDCPKAAWRKLTENSSVAITAGEYVDRTISVNLVRNICVFSV